MEIQQLLMTAKYNNKYIVSHEDELILKYAKMYTKLITLLLIETSSVK